ncbi:MAG: PAS domain-containing protein, partial [Planctomycetes bacterium]|nr:PAS domain-containing protein [Planctomycetota bacterium]
HPDDRARVLGTFERALETGQETTGYTYRFRCRDGRYASIRDRVFLMRDEEGRVYRALGAMEDITEQTRREEETLRNNNLESLGLLAGGIAHDFNNQLNIMLGNLLLLREDVPLDEEARPLFDDLEAATRHCVDLTRHLVTFARRGPSHPQVGATFAMGELVEEMTRLLRRTLPPSVRLTTDVADDLAYAVGDRAQAQQVLMNLC